MITKYPEQLTKQEIKDFEVSYLKRYKEEVIKMSNMRAPTDEEKLAIVRALMDRDGLDDVDAELEEFKEIVDDASIVVFPDYITGSPGYAGKLVLFCSNGSPDQFECFTFDGEKAVIQKQMVYEGD